MLDVGEKQTILVVDDTPSNIDVLSGILRPEYRVKAARDGERALKVARGENKPDMILLDIMMPGMDGYEVCKALKSDPSTAAIPVIFVTAKSEAEDEQRGLDLGAVDYLNKPVVPGIALQRVRTQLALYNQERHLQELVKARTQQLEATQLEIIRTLGRAAEYRDSDTRNHAIRMSLFARLMAMEMSDDESWIENIYLAAPMHDIGKIGIPEQIILKQDALEDDEEQIMQSHTLIGEKILGEHNGSELLKMAGAIAASHHERWDGSGYPRGLAGDQIPISARIVAIADTFDELTSAKFDRTSWSLDDAAEFIRDNAGACFDPELVRHFEAVLPEIYSIRKQFA